STPQGGVVLKPLRPEGRTVGRSMLAHVAYENAVEETLGSFGAVVGATLGDLSSYDLDMGGPLLAPGIGAQGATPADLPRVFGSAVRNVVPNVSRGVLRHGPDVSALRGAAERFATEIQAALAGV
ncbi:orotidine-5'-phosphate decarboxylase, partial [Streptomyces tricolor]